MKKQMRSLLSLLFSGILLMNLLPAAAAGRDAVGGETFGRFGTLAFEDVEKTAWYAGAVDYVCENGLMTGVGGGCFAPNRTATRAEVVTILYRLAGAPTVSGSTGYTDVRPGMWYADAVIWAGARGIVNGYEDGSFRPNDAVTREQLATLLYRCAEERGEGFEGLWYFPLNYRDAQEVSAWADEAMHWCVMRGVLTGTDGNLLAPRATATRAQLAAILQRLSAPSDSQESETAAAAAYDRLAAYAAAAVPAPEYGSLGGEWTVLGLRCGGSEPDAGYFDRYSARLEQAVQSCGGVLSTRKYTEYSRVILALSALGCDARDFADFDLTLPLGDYEKTVAQGVNGAIYALLALDSRNYPVPQRPDAAVQASRQRYVDGILSAQHTDGGWGFGENSDPDLTAMALQALAKYQEQSSVASAAARALDCLSGMQNEDGGYASGGVKNAESCAQVLLALNELGISVDDQRFTKNGCTVLSALLTFQRSDGSFCHVSGGKTDLMASEQALCALASLVRAERGETSFYRMDALS